MSQKMTSRDRCRAMTLLEVTVSLGVGMAVLGMLFYAFWLTQRRSDQQILAAQALAEATQISARVARVLEFSYDPATLGLDWGKQAPAAYKSQQLETFSLAQVSQEKALQYIIKNQSEDGKSRSVMIGKRDVQQLDKPEGKYQLVKAGPSSDIFSSTIEFGYANEFDQKLQPLLSKVDQPGRPKYVRYKITITDKDSVMEREVSITSGVALK
ncbi:type II secretion system protein J [Candidatus Sumerlaeota bacterium]